MSLKKLQARHKNFVNLCFKKGSNTDAYLEAFPNTKSRHTAAANANRLLNDPLVKEYYNKQKADFEAKSIATAEEVMRTYTKILRREIPDYSTDRAGEISEHPAKLADVIRAGEALLKRLDKTAEENMQNNKEKKYGVIIMPETKGEA